MSQVDKLLEQIHAEIDVRTLSPVQYGVVDNESLVEYALAYLLANLDDAFRNTEPTIMDVILPDKPGSNWIETVYN